MFSRAHEVFANHSAFRQMQLDTDIQLMQLLVTTTSSLGAKIYIYFKNMSLSSSVQPRSLYYSKKILLSCPLHVILPSPCQQFISSELPFSSLEPHLTKPKDTHKILFITLYYNFKFVLLCGGAACPRYLYMQI